MGGERTHGRFAGFGRLRIRLQRQLQTHQALLLLAAAHLFSGLRSMVVLAALRGLGGTVLGDGFADSAPKGVVTVARLHGTGAACNSDVLFYEQG